MTSGMDPRDEAEDYARDCRAAEREAARRRRREEERFPSDIDWDPQPRPAGE